MSVSTLDIVESSDLSSMLETYSRRGRSIAPQVIVVILRSLDLIAPLTLGYLFYRVYCASFEPTFWAVSGRFSVIATVLSALIFQLVGCYRVDNKGHPACSLHTLAIGFAWLLAVGLMTAFLCKSLNDVSRVWTTLWLGSWCAILTFSRIYAARYVRARVSAGHMNEAIAVVGATDWAGQLCFKHKEREGLGSRIIGVFDDRCDRVAACFKSSVRPLDALLELGRRVHIDRIILALPIHAEQRILEIANRLQALSVDIVVCPDLSQLNLLNRPVVSHLGCPAIQITERPIPDGHFLAKVICDKIVAFLLLLAAAPLFAVVAIVIRLTSRGPILFRQPRLGYNNCEFQVLKFRSMRIDSADVSGGRQAQRDDNRVTAFGKFLRRSSIDELPQLINVLCGEMSLVGPRPLPIGMRTSDKYNHEIVGHYAHRHRVRPGITGWAQINGCRGATQHPSELEQRVELDLYYINNWSLVLDLKILFLTGVHLVNAKNAF